MSQLSVVACAKAFEWPTCVFMKDFSPTKDFTHAVVRTVGEDGRSRTVLLDVETASKLTNAEVTQWVSAGGKESDISPQVQKILSWDLGGMKRALAEGEKKGLLNEHSSIEEIEKYLKDYQEKHGLDFGLPELT